MIGIELRCASARIVSANSNPFMSGISMSVSTTSNDWPERKRHQALLRVGRNPHLVARRLQHRRQHVAEERAVVDQQHRLRHQRGAHLLAAEPVGERHRQEVADVDHLGGLPLDHGGAEDALT